LFCNGERTCDVARLAGFLLFHRVAWDPEDELSQAWRIKRKGGGRMHHTMRITRSTSSAK
jgi:hypothetical protein